MISLLRWLRERGEGGFFGGSSQHGHTSGTDGGTLGAVVGTGQIKSATGSAISSVAYSFFMHDCSFFPSFSDIVGGNTVYLKTYSGIPDPNDTIGAIKLDPALGTTMTARWRYLTASDDPTIWVVAGPTGDLLGVWAADDPIPGTTPAVQCFAATGNPLGSPILLKAGDLDGLKLPAQTLLEAEKKIAREKLRPEHHLFRALQHHANDAAPAKWLFENCHLVGSRLKVRPGHGN